MGHRLWAWRLPDMWQVTQGHCGFSFLSTSSSEWQALPFSPTLWQPLQEASDLQTRTQVGLVLPPLVWHSIWPLRLPGLLAGRLLETSKAPCKLWQYFGCPNTGHYHEMLWIWWNALLLLPSNSFSPALAGGIVLFTERSTNPKSSPVTMAVFESAVFAISSVDKGREQRLIEIRKSVRVRLQWLWLCLLPCTCNLLF